MISRVRQLNQAPRAERGECILYWSQMNRRVAANHALAYAAHLANQHDLPVLFYEGLTCSYPFASDRFHAFMMQGVPETGRSLKKLGVGYVFHVRRRKRDPNDAFYKLAEKAAAVVTDDYPVFVAHTHNESVRAKLAISYYAVDSSCVVPMAYFEKQEYAAYTIRPKIKRVLADCLKPVPSWKVKRPYHTHASELHTDVTDKNLSSLIASCEIDHSITPSTFLAGGRRAAENRLKHFLDHNLRRYARLSREPSAEATSRLSPYLHFGQISSLEVALSVQEYAAEHHLIAEEFLEELIVRRELAFNFARFSPALGSLDALPKWAEATLAKHDKDRREFVYSRDQFEQAATHDALWNAAQTELLTRGVIHGYYRMYWGKKIIEWSASHAEALETMIYLNDRFALDGRDPNTYTNILWCFGLHDRPWAERPIFGQIRYMSHEGMRRKTDADAYIQSMTQTRLV
jgi:deoxyribodipyrimidine photo-lyase